MFLQSHSLSFVALALMVAPGLAQLSTQCNLFGVVGDCSQFVNDFCTTINPLTITPFNSISKCYNGPGNAFKCDLTALLTVNVTGTPGGTNCNTALTTAAHGCPMGGQGQFSGAPFIFAVDPNNGTCGLPCGD
ncbi:TMV resistance protein Y3 [Mycena pura]|uniref:TMV resistance protein Y3 n=1 Tax=Mycena pura TaxID=153505 RepID=A0AAD6VB48_9AGAR|nr:TMV resistance protein Y3 [Mycena pura]